MRNTDASLPVLTRRAIAYACFAVLAVVVEILPAKDVLAAPDKTTSLPNIIFIVLDTTRGDRVSFNGYDRLTTPNLDKLALDSVVYTKAHSVSPWTLPSHMSMFTGLLPSEHGATWRAFAEPEDMGLEEILGRSFSLNDPSLLLTVRLKDSGYSTTGFSSNAWVSERTGFATGFDAFYEMWKQDASYREAFKWLPPGVRERELAPDGVRTLSEFETGDAGLVLREFYRYINLNDETDRPFFLFFNFIDPHYPYSPPMSWRYAYSDDTDLGERIAHFEFGEMSMQSGDQPVDVSRFGPFYDAEINYLDFAVGRLLERLREKGLYDDTLIIVTADHGEHLGEHGQFSHQFSVGEELLHVPLMIKYPGNSGQGTTIDNPLVSTIDVYQTILAAAKGQVSSVGSESYSRNLANMQGFDRKYLIAEYDYSIPYLRANQEAYPGFSVKDNSVVRRVVYDHQNRYEFADPDRFAVTPLDETDTVEGEGLTQASEELQRYLDNLVTSAVRHSEEPMDEETLQRLRSLGYVD